jgi:hypothetical protein
VPEKILEHPNEESKEPVPSLEEMIVNMKNNNDEGFTAINQHP